MKKFCSKTLQKWYINNYDEERCEWKKFPYGPTTQKFTSISRLNALWEKHSATLINLEAKDCDNNKEFTELLKQLLVIDPSNIFI